MRVRTTFVNSFSLPKTPEVMEAIKSIIDDGSSVKIEIFFASVIVQFKDPSDYTDETYMQFWINMSKKSWFFG